MKTEDTISSVFSVYMMKKKSTSSADRIQVFASVDEVQHYHTKKDKKVHRISLPLILLLIWIGLYICSILFGVTYYMEGTGGDAYNSASYFMKDIASCMERTYNWIFHAGDTGNIQMEYSRFLAVALAGAALAACGTVFQGTFRNVLAGPSTMGVMSGGSMGCMVYLLCFYGNPLIYSGAAGTGLIQPLCVLAGCFGGVSLILLVSMVAGKGKVSSTTMVIAGTVFSGIISNIVLVAQYWIVASDPSDGRVEELRWMMMGNFDKMTKFSSVAIMGIPIIVCLALLCYHSGKLNLLSFGEEEAETMGLNVKKYKNLMILTGTILTAMVVSFCGQIGFIGFLVPLVSRRLTGPDLRKLLPVSILGGAILMTVIFDIARVLQLTSYLSVITGPLGCALMLFTLFRKGGGRLEAGKSAVR